MVLAERGRIGGGRLEEEEGPDGWAPPVSRKRERGGRGRGRLTGWARPKKRSAGGKKVSFLFFQTNFPKSLSNLGLNKFDLWIFESFTSTNMHQHECNKNISQNLYLILFSQNLLFSYIEMLTK